VKTIIIVGEIKVGHWSLLKAMLQHNSKGERLALGNHMRLVRRALRKLRVKVTTQISVLKIIA